MRGARAGCARAFPRPRIRLPIHIRAPTVGKNTGGGRWLMGGYHASRCVTVRRGALGRGVWGGGLASKQCTPTPQRPPLGAPTKLPLVLFLVVWVVGAGPWERSPPMYRGASRCNVVPPWAGGFGVLRGPPGNTPTTLGTAPSTLGPPLLPCGPPLLPWRWRPPGSPAEPGYACPSVRVPGRWGWVCRPGCPGACHRV